MTASELNEWVAWLTKGKACSLALDKHYDRYKGGFVFEAALSDAIDQAFFR